MRLSQVSGRERAGAAGRGQGGAALVLAAVHAVC